MAVEIRYYAAKHGRRLFLGVDCPNWQICLWRRKGWSIEMLAVVERACQVA